MTKASKTIKGAKGVSSLRQGIPAAIADGDICIVMTPSVGQDYNAARSIASTNPVIIVNGFAKVCSARIRLLSQVEKLCPRLRHTNIAPFLSTPSRTKKVYPVRQPWPIS